MNVGPVSQSLILAGESAEVDVLVTRATPVPSGAAAAPSGQRGPVRSDQGVSVLFQHVAGEYAQAQRWQHFAGASGRSPLDLYRRVQHTNSAKRATQLLDVFA